MSELKPWDKIFASKLVWIFTTENWPKSLLFWSVYQFNTNQHKHDFWHIDWQNYFTHQSPWVQPAVAWTTSITKDFTPKVVERLSVAERNSNQLDWKRRVKRRPAKGLECYWAWRKWTGKRHGKASIQHPIRALERAWTIVLERTWTRVSERTWTGYRESLTAGGGTWNFYLGWGNCHIEKRRMLRQNCLPLCYFRDLLPLQNDQRMILNRLVSSDNECRLFG